jgi:hypothetical protein
MDHCSGWFSIPAPSAGPDSTLCSANPTMLLQADPLPPLTLGLWSVSSGTATVASVGDPNSSVTVQNGPATLVWTMYNGACGELTDQVVLSVQTCAVGIAQTPQTVTGVRYDAQQQRILIEGLPPESEVEVFDALGRSVGIARNVQGVFAMPMQQREEGVYLVRVGSSAGRLVRRVHVQH